MIVFSSPLHIFHHINSKRANFFTYINKMAPRTIDRKCVICQRSHSNDRLLGPLICSQTLSVHYKCIAYSPVAPKEEQLDDAGIAGVTTDFIFSEAARADQLVYIMRISISSFFQYVGSIYYLYIIVAYFLSHKQICNICKKRGRSLDAASTLGTTID